MKKHKKHVVLILLVAVLVVAGVALAMLWPLFSMRPAASGIVPGTDILSVQTGRNSIFFIPVEDGYIAVDSGTNPNKVQAEMARVGINPEDVVAVLLTHTDSDHVGGLSILPEYASIVLGTGELPLIAHEVRRNLFGYNSLPDGFMQDILVVEEGETLDLGDIVIECIHLPGHTPGSMAYLVNGEYLFTGDAMHVAADGTVSVHPFTMNKRTAEASIQRLLAFAPNTLVFTSHYGVHEGSTLS